MTHNKSDINSKSIKHVTHTDRIATVSPDRSFGSDRPKGRLRTRLTRVLALMLTAILVFSLSACAGNAQTTSASTAKSTSATASKTTTSTATQTTTKGADGTGPLIVTSVYPLYLAAATIARDIPGVRVANLTEEITGCLHDYQLTTGNMKTLERADVFIINGAGLEGYIDTIARDLPGLSVIEAAKGIPLIEENPHVWVSISLMIRQVETITAEMSRIDPANKEAYARNAQAYLDRLSALRQKMHASIDPLPERRIITVHEAFPYFAAEFDLEIAGVVEREPDSEPSAAELASTIDLIRRLKVKAVFAEPQYPSSAAQQIADEAGAKLYQLDPVASGDLKNLDAYLDIMEKNRLVLMEALK